MANTDNEAERQKGQLHMIWSIVGLVIMTGAWGILEFIDNTYENIAPDENTTLDEYRQEFNTTNNN